MHLVLRLGDGQIGGEGDDCIGPFSFSGHYDERGNVVMVKQYVGRHQVLYEGTYDGEGTIFGHWSISSPWSGSFAMKLEAADSSAHEEIETLPARVKSSPEG
jgi:hypothetical protein